MTDAAQAEAVPPDPEHQRLVERAGTQRIDGFRQVAALAVLMIAHQRLARFVVRRHQSVPG